MSVDAGCYTIGTEYECCTSKDGRAAFVGQFCSPRAGLDEGVTFSIGGGCEPSSVISSNNLESEIADCAQVIYDHVNQPSSPPSVPSPPRSPPASPPLPPHRCGSIRQPSRFGSRRVVVHLGSFRSTKSHSHLLSYGTQPPDPSGLGEYGAADIGACPICTSVTVAHALAMPRRRIFRRSSLGPRHATAARGGWCW